MEDDTGEQTPNAGVEEDIGRDKRDGLQTGGGKKQGTQTENGRLRKSGERQQCGWWCVYKWSTILVKRQCAHGRTQHQGTTTQCEEEK